MAPTSPARPRRGRTTAAAIAGVAFNSPVAVCKALDRTGAGAVAGIANCIGYLVGTGAKVISLSLGTTADSATLRNAVAAASRSALIVAAAGNSGASTIEYPAGYPRGRVGRGDRPARRSRGVLDRQREGRGRAPGVDVVSTWRDGGYRALSGTSMSTPHVAGVAAIIAARDRPAGRRRGGRGSTRPSTTSGRPAATRSSASAG